jgi:protocatechuate 3,4-dioxygenase, beta subunit
VDCNHRGRRLTNPFTSCLRRESPQEEGPDGKVDTRAGGRPLRQTVSELTAPTFVPRETILPINLAKGPHGDAVGERILVSGRVLDEDGRAVAGTLVEVWQANAAGRYLHARDQHDAPLDPNFTGCASFVTDTKGRYAFETIRPGEYPWRNHYKAWRPAHIHFSVFGPAFATRLITQMYFPGDPLLPFDPIFNKRQRQDSAGKADRLVRLGNNRPGIRPWLPVRYRAAWP